MNIDFNGNSLAVDEAVSLSGILEQQQLKDKNGIAVAVNDIVVARNNWTEHILKDKDKILVISATKGG